MRAAHIAGDLLGGLLRVQLGNAVPVATTAGFVERTLPERTATMTAGDRTGGGAADVGDGTGLGGGSAHAFLNERPDAKCARSERPTYQRSNDQPVGRPFEYGITP